MIINSKFFIYIFSALFLLIGCSSPNTRIENSSFFFSTTDMYGREISIIEKPTRIISLSPGITELIYLMKADSLLVGISDYCTFPSETQKKEKLGKITNVNIEKVISLDPDVVLIGSIISRDWVEKIEQSGIQVIAFDFESSFNQLFKNIDLLGSLLDKKSIADSLSNEYHKILANIDTTKMNHTSVYYVVGFGESGDFTAPQSSSISEIISLAGGKNVGDILTSGWQINREILFEENPDIILIRREDFDAFVKMPPYTSLDAVKKNHVFPIESGWIDLVSPRNFLAIEYLHSIIIDKSN